MPEAVIRLAEASEETPPVVSPPAPAPGVFVTVKELQRILPLSRRSIYAWRKAGILPSICVGSKVIFHVPSIEAALLRHQNGGAH